MDDKTEVIRHDIEATRESLAHKVEALEEQVVETVQGTTSAVAETVDTVKEAVQETVEQVKETVQGTVQAVKDTFDLRLHTERHPWLMFGGAVGVGFLAGAWLGGGKSAEAGGEEAAPVNYMGDRLRRPARSNGSRPAASVGAPAKPFAVPPPSEQPQPATGLMGIFGSELTKLKKLAIGTVLGLMHDLIEKNLPSDLGQHLNTIVDDLNDKLGGDKVKGPFFQRSPDGPHGGNGRDHAGEDTGNA